MEKLVEVLKPVLKTIALTAGLFLLFWYGGGFSERQSLVLAISLCALYWLLNSFISGIAQFLRREQQFQPFWVHVEPRWYELLYDNNLVSDKGEWEKIQQQVKNLMPSEYNVLRDGITFIVLKPSNGSSYPGLIYRSDLRQRHFGYSGWLHLATQVDFCEPIREFIKKPTDWTGSFFAPEVFIKWGADGYDLGITLDIVDGRYPQRQTLAVLPYAEFGHYHTPWEDFPFKKKWARWRKLRGKRKEALHQHGWKIQGEWEEDPELGHIRYCVEHRFFTVSHNALP